MLKLKSGPTRYAPSVRLTLPIAYSPVPSIETPAMSWQRDSVFCAGIHLSATMPIRAGINMETNPCVAKKSQIWGPSPALPRKLPIDVRYAPQMAYWRKFIMISLRLMCLLLITLLCFLLLCVWSKQTNVRVFG